MSVSEEPGGTGQPSPPTIPIPAPHLQESGPAPHPVPPGTYGLPPPTEPHEHPDKEDKMETEEEKIRPCERGGRAWGGRVCPRDDGRATGRVVCPWAGFHRHCGCRVLGVGGMSLGLVSRPWGGCHLTNSEAQERGRGGGRALGREGAGPQRWVPAPIPVPSHLSLSPSLCLFLCQENPKSQEERSGIQMRRSGPLQQRRKVSVPIPGVTGTPCLGGKPSPPAVPRVSPNRAGVPPHRG